MEQPKKKRKKRKRPRPEETNAAASPASAAATASPKRFDWGKWFWVLLLAVGIVELFVYGYRGEIEVCVGRQGVTDFALAGEPRTDENRSRYPECHRAGNVGLRGDYEDIVQEAAIHACRRATLFQGQDVLLACAAGLEPFEHRVESRFVPPWDPAYYRRLFWFIFS
jgi:hypothetical protein